MNIIEIYKKFPTNQDCLKYLEQIRWKDGQKCPYCGSDHHTPIKEQRASKKTGEIYNVSRYHCLKCHVSYSVTVGTIFHDTKLDLQIWFLAISLILNAKKGISSRQLARDLQVNKNTALRLQHRVSRAMSEDNAFISGIVEADETYVGGKNKNRHKNKKTKGGQGRSQKGKTPVAGVIQRGGNVIAGKVKDVTGKTLKSFINKYVEKGSLVNTDEWAGYKGLEKEGYDHKKVDHKSGRYVIDGSHTNTLEGFWALLKRGLMGQYHHLSEKYLDLYIAQFSMRYNHRDNPDLFLFLMKRCLGNYSF